MICSYCSISLLTAQGDQCQHNTSLAHKVLALQTTQAVKAALTSYGQKQRQIKLTGSAMLAAVVR